MACAVGSRLIMVVNNLRVELDPATFERLSNFARGYLAHAENDEHFMDQSYYFDGFDIFFSVAVNGWVNVSAYPSSVDSGTNWGAGFVLFNTRGGE